MVRLIMSLITVCISVVGLMLFLYAQSFQISAYDNIDRHACNSPKRVEKSIQSLASYLVEPARSEWEKVRAIYSWITNNITYNTEGYFTGRYGDLSPDGILSSRRAVCEGYAGLFQSLGQAVGLEVVKISGYSKGYGYSVGDSFSGPTNHTWNAVKINGQWYLLDSTWGAGYLNENGQFVHRFQEHYFLTAPKEFIYDHLPDNPKWQLLAQPISKKEYANLVYLRPAFFHTGLTIKSHPQSTIKTDNQVLVTLLASDDALLLARLKNNKHELDESFTFTQKNSSEYMICAVFPHPGKYILRLFAKRKDAPGMYNWALDYKVEATNGKQGAIGFPKTYESFNEYSTYLYTPLKGNLKLGSTQTFKLRVPVAEDAAVIINGKWFHLQKKGDLFEGDVVITGNKVGVYAKFLGNNQYNGLLQYVGF